MKVVADTMIWVSYFSNEQSFRHQLIEEALQRRTRFFVSEYLANELREILVREMGFSRRDTTLALKKLSRVCKTVELPDTILRRVVNDEKDDAIVETAIRAKAHFLVTADQEILKLEKVGNVSIISALEFARQLGWKATA